MTLYSQKDIDALNYERVQAKYLGQYKFLPAQAQAILEYRKRGKVFAIVVVGGGKTLICQSIASIAYEQGMQKTMYIMPANAYEQIQYRDTQFARKHFVISCPFHFMGGLTKRKRSAISKSDRPGCYVVPYSLLQTRDGEEILNDIKPELVICDEMHYLKHLKKSARTQRLFRYIKQHKPQLVMLSGTITDKSIRDYHHLITATLDELSPLPREYMAAMEWSGVIDADAEINNPDDAVPIIPLILWAREKFPEEEIRSGIPGFRDAYKVRLRSCPGVVHKKSDELGVTLNIVNSPVKHTQSQELKDLIKQAEVERVSPNGDPIEHAIILNKWLRELNCGFWNKLTFPEPEAFAKRKGISLDEATKLVDAAVLHHMVHNEYLICLRRYLSHHKKPGLDTPFLIGNHMYRHEGKGLPGDLVRLWKRSKELEVKGMPSRERTPIVVDYFRAEHVADIVEYSGRKNFLIFYYHQTFGKMLVDVLTRRGLNPLHCPAGKEGNMAILRPEACLRPTVASIKAHGQSKNLQYFKTVVFADPIRSAIMAEQSIGRVHRTGQEADEIFTYTTLTTQFDILIWAACLNDTLYSQQSTGIPQKVIYANYNPPPTIVPSGFLEERGFQPKRLDDSQQQQLIELFEKCP